MQLERLTVELRPRNSWETLDLGLAMLRVWRGPVLRAWCATYWPFALLVGAAAWTHPWLGALIVWWSKPVFDRVLLHVYSNAVFGNLPSVSDVWRAVPRLLRHTRLLAALTLYRFSMARSFFLPVWQLEDQRGKAAAARRRVLGARGYGYAAWLTFVCSNLVLILVLSGIALTWMLLPEGSDSEFLRDMFEPQSLSLARYSTFLGFVAETAVEPYFVAAGFSLYLNRRSELEAWDIELAFRQMARRRNLSPGAAASLACLVAALALVLAATPFSAAAADDDAPGRATAALPATDAAVAPHASVAEAAPYVYPAGEIQRRAKAILDDPVFGQKEMRSRWVYRASAEPSELPPWLRALRKWLLRVSETLASLGRVIVWVAAAALLALAIYLVVRYRERLRPRLRREPPQMLFGLDVRRESLPSDIAAAARELLARGETVAVLSLLYRGALSALIHAAAVEFRAGDTEGDCWRRAQPVMSADGLGYFRRLLDAWLWAAYGRRPPPTGEVQGLCEAWPRHFGADTLSRNAMP